ncbi:uncharacterized protein LOC129853155 [Salvelinus fontinalis]|uniref:uncharacterized protein LOC129853155 n=1 Tax=Salvelinus fontinalis TaxID=8038 RepID=UPI002486C626|nr:uncharacterized protein LOC129853155 [Salvelinus fontinalis]
MLTSANWKLLPTCLSHFLNMFYFAVAINTHTPTLQPSNPPPIAAQELSDTVAPQETSFTLILNQVEPPITPTNQETSFTPILNQVEPPITPTNQETSFTPILNQVEPPITSTAQETSFTPILNQVEPLISPITQETSYTPILNQVEPPITPTNQETSFTPILNQVEPLISPITQETSYTLTKPKKTGRKSCNPQKTLHLAEHDTVNPILPHPTVSYPIKPHQTPSNRVQPHPTPSNPILTHPTPSNPILPRPRKKKYDYMQKECPVHPGQTIFPVLKILAIKTSEEVNLQNIGIPVTVFTG